MTKAIPTVQTFMTTCPHTVGTDQSLEVAEQLMHKYRIRHLPVLEGGRLKGLISDRDVKLCRTLFGTDEGIDIKIGETCQEEVYTVSPASPLNEVVNEMARKKLGSAVVVDNGKVVGIMTSIDVMTALGRLLETRLKTA